LDHPPTGFSFGAPVTPIFLPIYTIYYIEAIAYTGLSSRKRHARPTVRPRIPPSSSIRTFLYRVSTHIMRSDRDSAAFPLTRLMSCSLLQYCPSPPLFFSSPAGRFFARVAKMPGPFVPGSLTDHGLLLPLRLRLLRSCVFCFCGFLTGTMWDSRWGLVTAADYWCIHHQWRGIPAPEIECHVTCGALFFLTTCSLLLSNDIISELKSLLCDYGDALVHAGWSGLVGGLTIDLVRSSIARAGESKRK
jgi:hypothetical protein